MASGETTLTLIGNLTADPELRFTQDGNAVVNFTVASTPRIFDRQANEWKDAEASFMRCSAWRQMAENIAASFTKGSRVIVVGRLKQRSYETKEGEKRTTWEVEADEVGGSVKFESKGVTAARESGGSGGTTSGWETTTRPRPLQDEGGTYGDEAPF